MMKDTYIYFMIICQDLANKIHQEGRLYLILMLGLVNFDAFPQSSQASLKLINSGEMVKDADNNCYRTVRLGDQTWMAENLKTTRYSDETPIPFVTDSKKWSALTTPGYCWYDHNEETGRNKYGVLYNWYTVNTGKLCPQGWHVPRDTEWVILEKYLIASGYDYEGINTANKIAKSLASSAGWTSSVNRGAVGNTDYPEKRNATGFSALPGGYRYYDGTFHGIGSHGDWWYATEHDAESAWGRNLLYFYDSVHRGLSSKKNGFSVRCLKD